MKGVIKLNKLIKVLLTLFGFIVSAIAILALIFFLEMKPDKDEEEKVRVQAEEYLEENYKDQDFEIYDVLYDNMGNFGYFEYAALVRNTDTGVEFKVYYNNTTQKVEDDLKLDQEETHLKNKVEPLIKDYIEKNLGDKGEVDTSYSYDRRIAMINLKLMQGISDQDEQIFEDFISYLKNDLKLEHADVIMYYSDKNEEKVWEKEF